MTYVELQSASNFSFLRGASDPGELVSTAAALGYKAFALTDFHTLSGIVRAQIAAEECGLKLIVGARFELRLLPLEEQQPVIAVLLHATSLKSYGNLCRLITCGGRRGDKNNSILTVDDLIGYHSELCITIVPSLSPHPEFSNAVEKIRAAVKDLKYLSIALVRNYNNNSRAYEESVHKSASAFNIPIVATNDVYYHDPGRRQLQDILTCVRHGCTIGEAGFKLFQNSERYIKPLEEMKRLFRREPEALARTLEIAEMTSGFSLRDLRYDYPDPIIERKNGSGNIERPATLLEYLSDLTWQGANEHYPEGVPEKVQKLIAEELSLIHELKYEKYFLTCYDIVRFAKACGILCQGRGAAANSAVCYCLNITAVDPNKVDLLFARFISKERSEPPDIDIDFEHERREEVIQYIYRKYGREHAAITCEVITYRHRSAVRDVGKALGLSLEIVNLLAKSIHRWTGAQIPRESLIEIGLNPDDELVLRTIKFSRQLLGFPRHLSQHVGGFVISGKPLCEIVPILNSTMADRTFIEWDKDDIEVLGMLKIDVLGLGMLSCIRKALEYVNKRRAINGESALSMHSLPREDSAVYDMICEADTIGAFQIESRAQMSMLPRLRPRRFYDLVIEVAIVRPGPIQGNMVHPYLKRRDGLEQPIYPDERVREVLSKTLGVPLFQEQAMRLTIVMADFTPGEAEKLRRAMASWKRNKHVMLGFQNRIREGMLKNGYSEEYADNFINQIKGFSEYGFPESHAASFALLVYVSCWLKLYYPAEFGAALLNSQPMGFYAPSQIVRDLINPSSTVRRPVNVLPIDINRSVWDCDVECYKDEFDVEHESVRLGTRLVKGLSRKESEALSELIAASGEIVSLADFWSSTKKARQRIGKRTLHRLAEADAFASINLDRHQAHWMLQALPSSPFELEGLIPGEEHVVAKLPSISLKQNMLKDYRTTGLSLKAHPFEFMRGYLSGRNCYTAHQIRTSGDSLAKKRITVAGIPIVRQRPPTASGVVFLTLEDETGIVNLIIRPKVFEQYSKIIISGSCLLADGILEQVKSVIYINASFLESLDSILLEIKDLNIKSKNYSY